MSPEKLVRDRSTPELAAWWDEVERLAALAPTLRLDAPEPTVDCEAVQ